MSTSDRTLLLLRHAKSDYPDDVADHERPLAPRGVRDAPHTGTWLADAGRVPDLVLCSDALRTRQTYELVAADWDPPPEVRYTGYVLQDFSISGFTSNRNQVAVLVGIGF